MAHDQLVAWLNDAYALEQGLIPILQNHAADTREDFPDAALRIEQHIAETRMHVERLDECFRELGTRPSTLKSTLASIMGTVESVATGMFRDETVKNALLDYASEQFEVGCYLALVTAAHELGHYRIAELCEQNMREDEAMALWLRGRVPLVVSASLEMGV